MWVISLWRPLLFYSPLGERYGRDKFKGSTVLDFILSYFLSGGLKEIRSYRIQVNKYDPRGAWDHEGSPSLEMVRTTTWSISALLRWGGQAEQLCKQRTHKWSKNHSKNLVLTFMWLFSSSCNVKDTRKGMLEECLFNVMNQTSKEYREYST